MNNRQRPKTAAELYEAQAQAEARTQATYQIFRQAMQDALSAVENARMERDATRPVTVRNGERTFVRGSDTYNVTDGNSDTITVTNKISLIDQQESCRTLGPYLVIQGGVVREQILSLDSPTQCPALPLFEATFGVGNGVQTLQWDAKVGSQLSIPAQNAQISVFVENAEALSGDGSNFYEFSATLSYYHTRAARSYVTRSIYVDDGQQYRIPSQAYAVNIQGTQELLNGTEITWLNRGDYQQNNPYYIIGQDSPEDEELREIATIDSGRYLGLDAEGIKIPNGATHFSVQGIDSCTQLTFALSV